MTRRSISEKGFSVVEAIIIATLLTCIGLGGWIVLSRNKSKQSTTSTSSASIEQTTSEAANADSTELLWRQSENGWQALQSPPACADPLEIATPTDLSQATAVLYPGQTRGGNYKAHGGFRFDNTPGGQVTVKAPLAGFVVRGSRYIEAGEEQFLFDFMNNCGIMYRFDHLRALSPELQAIADTWPKAQENESRTQNVNPPKFVAQGQELASAVGFKNAGNISFDFGMYDYRSENKASQQASYRSQHPNKELDWHALCWFDLLSTEQEAVVRSLPAGDSASGSASDYCD